MKCYHIYIKGDLYPTKEVQQVKKHHHIVIHIYTFDNVTKGSKKELPPFPEPLEGSSPFLYMGGTLIESQRIIFLEN